MLTVALSCISLFTKRRCSWFFKDIAGEVLMERMWDMSVCQCCRLLPFVLKNVKWTLEVVDKNGNETPTMIRPDTSLHDRAR
jgi:hypothetical protein